MVVSCAHWEPLLHHGASASTKDCLATPFPALEYPSSPFIQYGSNPLTHWHSTGGFISLAC